MRPDLNDLIRRTVELLQVDAEDLLGGSRAGHVSVARSVICYLAAREGGISGVEIGRMLRLSRSGVCRAVRRGQEIVRENRWLREILGGSAVSSK